MQHVVREGTVRIVAMAAGSEFRAMRCTGLPLQCDIFAKMAWRVHIPFTGRSEARTKHAGTRAGRRANERTETALLSPRPPQGERRTDTARGRARLASEAVRTAPLLARSRRAKGQNEPHA